MEKITRTRRYRRLRPTSHMHVGLVRIGKTSVSIPLEHLAYLGRPTHLYQLTDDRQSLNLVPSDGLDPQARTVRCRPGRYRGYIKLNVGEARMLRPGLYNPLTEYDKQLKERVLRLERAVITT